MMLGKDMSRQCYGKGMHGWHQQDTEHCRSLNTFLLASVALEVLFAADEVCIWRKTFTETGS